jgi:hypothetical protein
MIDSKGEKPSVQPALRPIAFKFLAHGARSPMTDFAWIPGAWVEVEGELAPCARGIHVLRPRDTAHWIHDELWRIEHEGEAIDGIDCVVVRRARLAEPVLAWREGGAVRFARACHDRLRDLLARVGDVPEAWAIEKHRWAASVHVDKLNPAMAAYNAATGFARAPLGATPQERFRAERAWQSAWLERELPLP